VLPGSDGREEPDAGDVDTDDILDRAPDVDTGSERAAAGSGGVVDATTDGGVVIIGDVESGSDAGSEVGVDVEETVDSGAETGVP
jgi:hypothetical protein